jgi:hypothetical protein
MRADLIGSNTAPSAENFDDLRDFRLSKACESPTVIRPTHDSKGPVIGATGLLTFNSGEPHWRAASERMQLCLPDSLAKNGTASKRSACGRRLLRARPARADRDPAGRARSDTTHRMIYRRVPPYRPDELASCAGPKSAFVTSSRPPHGRRVARAARRLTGCAIGRPEQRLSSLREKELPRRKRARNRAKSGAWGASGPGHSGPLARSGFGSRAGRLNPVVSVAIATRIASLATATSAPITNFA